MAEAPLPSINQLESYLEDVLRKKQSTAKYSEILATAKLEEIRNLIDYLQQKLDSQETIGVRHLIDVGSQIFVESSIDDMALVQVEVTNGFYVTMLLSEAVEFLRKRLILAEE